VGRVVHFEIHCEDLDRAEAFYRDVLGWQVQRWEGAPIDYRLITTGPASDQPGIDGAMLKRPVPVTGDEVAVIGYVNTVSVDDLGSTLERALAAGGRMALDRNTIPGVGDVAYIKDPEGNVLGLLQPEAPQAA
jgi:uncharacterized protein